MKLVNNRVLKDGYDVIVVGAGLGGMTAASLLAKRGLSVLMIDRQDKPGGSCTSFRRDGVTYDVGTAMLYGFGENGFKPFRFLMNELEEPVEVVKHATLARMTFEGHTITFWPDVERFLQELDPLFPEEKEGLRAFYRDLYELYEHIVIKNEVIVPPSEYNSRQGMRSLRSGPLKMLRMVRLLSTSTRSLLDRYFHTPDVINFFDKLCSAYCYCTADETPAVLAATMFLDNHIGGVYYPAGGAQMLPNKIEKRLNAWAGRRSTAPMWMKSSSAMAGRAACAWAMAPRSPRAAWWPTPRCGTCTASWCARSTSNPSGWPGRRTWCPPSPA